MKRREGRVILYLADIRPLYQEILQQKVYALAGEERRRKADLCRDKKAKAASLAAGFLADHALRENGLGHCTIGYAPGGQPMVKVPEEEPPVYISLSHSGDYAVCALAHCPVGVDIQREQPVRTGMLRHFFTQEQRIAFQKTYGIREAVFLPAAAQKAFLRCWTAKESYMKLTGDGMAMGFDGMTADLANGFIFAESPKKPEAYLREYRAPEGYFLTACSQTGENEWKLKS